MPRFGRFQFPWAQLSLKEHLLDDIVTVECDWIAIESILKNEAPTLVEQMRCITIKHLLCSLVIQLRRIQAPNDRHVCHVVYPSDSIDHIYNKFISLWYCLDVEKLDITDDDDQWANVCYTMVDLYATFFDLINKSELFDE